MRVLFTTYPEKTVFQYLVTLAWALRTAGHEVCFASQVNFTDVITQAGLTAVGVGGDEPPWRVTHLDPEQLEAERAGLPVPYDVANDPAKATWEHLEQGYAGPVVNRYVMESVPMIPDLVAFARHWQPDLVVWESNCYAGPIAAQACGAAHARLLFGIDIFGITRQLHRDLKQRQPPENRTDALADWFHQYAAAYGGEFTEDLVTGHATIDQFPASLQSTAAGLDYIATRYVPYGGPASVPTWLWEPPDRPRVALTLGLSATEHFGGYTTDVQQILDALADLDVEVVATIAERIRETLDPLPANVRAVPYVPLHALAPTCAAVIHHAGAATLATVSLSGVPQLALPLHFDQPLLARNLAAQGAGLTLDAHHATGEGVRSAVLRLLSEASFRDRAAALSAEMLAQPSPNEVVGRLEQLAVTCRTR